MDLPGCRGGSERRNRHTYTWEHFSGSFFKVFLPSEISNAASWFLSVMRTVALRCGEHHARHWGSLVVKRQVLSLPFGDPCVTTIPFSLLHQPLSPPHHLILAFPKISSWALLSQWSEIHPRAFVLACVHARTSKSIF